MFKHLRLATVAAALALSYGFTGAASADELPDLVINSVKLEATGRCDRFSPVVVGDLVRPARSPDPLAASTHRTSRG